MSDQKRPDNEGNEPSKSSDKKNEIRYVPVEYMQDPGYGFPDDDEIDLLELAKKIWQGRWKIIKITSVFIFLGVFWALFSAEEFESDALLMPEIQAEQGAGGASQLLQRFGGAFGISGGSGMPAGTIPPQIYPQIVSSITFQLELLEQEMHFREYDVTTTWPDFLENHYSRPITGYIKDYTIGLPFTILGGVKSLFSSEDEEESAMLTEDVMEQEYISLSQEEFEIIKQLRERINVSQDQETGLLTTRVKLQDARAAAEMNRYLINLLKEYVTEYRVEKARQNLEFAEQQKDEAEERFRETQMALAEFQDRNVTISTARAQTELERLQDEKNLALNVYQTLAQRVEEARLNLQEQTPIFSEVQPANVPTERSEPKRGMMVIIFTLLGGILSVGWVLIEPLIGTLKESVFSSES